jgi:DNA invertase Pin-like site-specific DNA recombinase
LPSRSASSALCGASHKAEFERYLIRARTGEGRERAKRRGVRFGRNPKLTPQQRSDPLRRLAEGDETRAELARRYNVHPSTISRLAA